MRIGFRSNPITPLGLLLTIASVLSGLLASCGLVVLVWGLLDRESGVDLGRTALGSLIFLLFSIACVALDRRLFK
jgi:hypothetical protein